MPQVISIEIVKGSAAIEAMRDEWKNLFAESDPSPFLTWEWLTAWYRFFGDGSTPFILKAYRGGSLIGILPLRRIVNRILGIASTRLALLGDEHGGADYLDVIASTDNRDRVADAFADHLLNVETGADAIIFKNLSASSPLRKSLQAADQYFERKGFICPQINLNGGWPAVLANCRRTSNFKRRLKQLERLPGFEFRSVTRADLIPGAFQRFIELHNSRWSPNGGSDLSGGPRLLSFHKEVIDQMAGTGLLRFDELWVKEYCVASAYAFDNGRTFFYFNAGYDPAWASHSVGLVLTGLSIRAACERGNETYDFMRGDEAYKFDWANRIETTIKACFVRRTLGGHAFATAEKLAYEAKKISGALLPTPVANQLRALRRLQRGVTKIRSA